jgi:hypothetical protein
MWPDGRSARFATWPSTSTSASTGRLSGRSPKRSQLSLEAQVLAIMRAEYPPSPRTTRRDQRQIPVPHPYDHGQRGSSWVATAATTQSPAARIQDAKLESALRAGAPHLPFSCLSGAVSDTAGVKAGGDGPVTARRPGREWHVHEARLRWVQLVEVSRQVRQGSTTATPAAEFRVNGQVGRRQRPPVDPG